MVVTSTRVRDPSKMLRFERGSISKESGMETLREFPERNKELHGRVSGFPGPAR